MPHADKTAGPLDKPRQFLLVEASQRGPLLFPYYGSVLGALDLVTRWAALRCVSETATLWMQTRRGWRCVGNDGYPPRTREI